MLISIFSDGPEGKCVHIVDPTEVTGVIAWLEEQGHSDIRIARSAEECQALLEEQQVEAEKHKSRT